MEGDVVDLDVDAEPRVLHGVAREVLDARHHVALQAACERGAELADVERVLAVGLLRPPPGRVTEQVDAHRPGQVRADRSQLGADRVADALLQVEVPGGTTCHRHRERSRVADHRTAWAVGEPDAREPDPLELGADEHRLVVAVLAQELQPRPRGRVTVEAPELLVLREVRDECPGGVPDGHTAGHCRTGVVEGSHVRAGDGVVRSHGPASSGIWVSAGSGPAIDPPVPRAPPATRGSLCDPSTGCRRGSPARPISERSS